ALNEPFLIGKRVRKRIDFNNEPIIGVISLYGWVLKKRFPVSGTFACNSFLLYFCKFFSYILFEMTNDRFDFISCFMGRVDNCQIDIFRKSINEPVSFGERRSTFKNRLI